MPTAASSPRLAVLLTLALLVLATSSSRAQQEGVVLQTGEIDLLTRASLKVNGNADTAWIGHVVAATGLPGTPGGYGPYHIGRGPNNIVWPFGPAPPPVSYNGVWDFDQFQVGEPDSSQGWRAVAPPYVYTATTEQTDRARPFDGLDYGNQGNYVSNVVTCPAPCVGPPAGKSTFGVLGYWHRDPGSLLAPSVIPGTTPASLTWAPIAGTASAWCGLRSHGDVAVSDPETGNAFNQTVLQYTDVGISNFPGYGSQWDQMLYRDVSFAANATGNVTISFQYATNMSLGSDGARSSQIGWFDKDPLKLVAPNDGNFISATDAQPTLAGPVDSFMVRIGAPVSDAAVLYSDGTVAPVYDPQRRWFSEVLKINTPGTTYRTILSVAGVNGTAAAPITFTTVLPAAAINAILDADGGAGNGGRVRIVFRVKTNRGFDDQGPGFSSGTAGAAIVDNVSVTGGGATPLVGDFEAAGSINNSLAVPATSAWKTTGKPPGIYFHLHDVASVALPLVFDDPCGALGSPTSRCNMRGAVVSAGDHDLFEKTGGVFGGNTSDRRSWFASPTINLRSVVPGDFNGMGIDAEIADATGDYALWFDAYSRAFDFAHTGNAFRIGWQSYPVVQPNGVRCWGPVRMPVSLTSSTGWLGCASGFGSGASGAFARQYGLIQTSNSNSIPDSLRVYIESVSACFTLPVTAASCSPSTGPLAGGYFDNLSLAFIDAPRSPRASVAPWDLFNDAFPDNPTNILPSAAGFNLLTAKVKSGRNISQMTKNISRHDIPGDSAVVTAPGPGTRMDLVFRIKPGVGNHPVVGVPGLVTTAPGGPVAVAGDGSWWGTYLGNTGVFGTGGGVPHDPDGPGPIAPGTQWDPNAWNSAQMDTAEINLFPAGAVDPNLGRLTVGSYMTTYIESEVAPGGPRAPLGVLKPRCVLMACAPRSPVNASNISCVVPPPVACTGPGSGFSPAEAAAGTLEYTKILPDGQFTPGTHIEYFFHRFTVSGFENMPDTNLIYPQLGEGNLDGHRWQEFSVLPDRWKNPAFGGQGLACILVVDLGDRRGDELAWVSYADTSSLTAPAARGAHNGWHGNPGLIPFMGVDVSNADEYCRRDHGGQAGTFWDLYQVKGGESNVPAGRLGSRGASQASPGLAAGKFSTLGPSGDMARIYRTIVLLGSDLGGGTLGPYPDQTDADVGLINDFTLLPGGSAQPRAVMAMGRNFADGLTDPMYTLGPFSATTFRATLRNTSYQLLSGNTADVADMIAVPPVSPAGGFTYGVWNSCRYGNDVLAAQVTAPPGMNVGTYEAVGVNGPYVSSVYAAESGAGRPFKTLINGWTLGAMGGMGTETTLLPVGTRKYFYDLWATAFASLTCQPLGTPVAVGDQGDPGSSFTSFMSLRSANPARSGESRIAFGIAKTERVEIDVYDVTGRLVKRVANRVFDAGVEHVVIWDGTSDDGLRARSGIYFFRLRTPSWTSQKRLTVLSN